MAKKVTVAVPIYNVEPYLQTCIDSVLAQTYVNMEVLLVDDGSPDRCGEICDRYAEKDRRVRVLHKENGGLSSARNAALDAATGEYIIFVDGDDWIEPRMIEVMMQRIETHNADLATVNMQSFLDETGEMLKNHVMPELQDAVLDFHPADFRRIRALYGKQLTIFGANSLYCVALVKKYNLRFEDTKIVLSEDQLFNYCYYAVMRRAVLIGEPMYHYRIRGASLSHEKKPVNILNRRLTWVRYLRHFLDVHALPRQKASLYASISWDFFSDGCTVLGSPDRVVAGLNAIEPDNRKVFRSMLRHMFCGEVYKQYVIKYNLSPRAALYFRYMLLLLYFGKYQKPAETFLCVKN